MLFVGTYEIKRKVRILPMNDPYNMWKCWNSTGAVSVEVEVWLLRQYGLVNCRRLQSKKKKTHSFRFDRFWAVAFSLTCLP